MTVVVGTAGHIDHGKTTLLRALTGIDADRLPEERARGMTIDVGYAHLVLDGGGELDFVDVPGHDRLVGNMLVGAGEIDAALLVVAADDGPRAQTIEHLELLDALGIDDGLVVVTKLDAVEPDRLALAVEATRSLIAETTLRRAPVLAASATTGDGLPELRLALAELSDRVAGRVAATRPGAGSRLAIDRAFAIRGRGTVVTGSLRGDPIERGAVVRILPSPTGAMVRVREVQVHGRAVERGGPGRVALNVVGEGVRELERGVVLATDPAVVDTDRLLVALRPAARLGGANRTTGRVGLPPDRTRAVVHLGTARVGVTVDRAGRDGVALDDGSGSAILRLERPMALSAGDRFVIRRPSPPETLAGGRVLDPEPPRGIARRRATADRIAAIAGAEPGSAAWAAARRELHGVGRGSPPELAGDVADAVDATLAATVTARDGVHAAELVRVGATDLRHRIGSLGPGRTGDGILEAIVTARLGALVSAGQLSRDADRISLPGTSAAGPGPELAAAMEDLVARLSVASPPSLGEAARASGCPPEGIRLLERENRIVRLDDDLAWAAPAWRDLAVRALDLATTAPLTPAAYRDATGTSRKYVMAILEDLDRRAILRRTPAGHVPGPRAAGVRAEAGAETRR